MRLIRILLALMLGVFLAAPLAGCDKPASAPADCGGSYYYRGYVDDSAS